MADKSKIEWTDSTWNPLVARRLSDGKLGFHCEKVSPGCAHCYAEVFNGRELPARGTGLPYTIASREKVQVEIEPSILQKPLRWKRRRMIFVESMSDLFGEFVPIELIDQVFAVMALSPRHAFQVLTKRVDRMAEYISRPDCAERIIDAAAQIGEDAGTRAANFINGWSNPKQFQDGNPANGTVRRWPLPNVWCGCTVENQEWADNRREALRSVPAALRYVSYEPALGPVDWSGWEFIDWLIAGGESGHGARATNLRWHRETRDWCAAHDVAFFEKQLGARPVVGGDFEQKNGPMEALVLAHRKGADWSEWPEDLRVRQLPQTKACPCV